MKKIKVLIVEDINTVSIDIHNIIKEMGYEIQQIVSSGEEALSVIDKLEPQIVLVDTVLNGELDGAQTAIQIRDRYNIPVVFLSSLIDNDIIGKIKQTGAYGFILKPFNKNVLKASIEIALSKFAACQKSETGHIQEGSDKQFIFVRADYKLNKIDLDEIYYVEALKDYVVIHTGENIYTTHATMKAMTEALPAHQFTRIHRSYIVSLDKIHSIKYPDLVIKGKMKILPIGGHYRKVLYNHLNIL